jgi:choline-sulfatase
MESLVFHLLFQARRWCCRVGSLAVLWGCAVDVHIPDPGETEAADQAAPMNLLLIAVDTLRADHLGTYGFQRTTSYNIDRFFDQSLVFTEANATAPWTLPSFASMMTSQHSSTHGCWRFSDSLDDSFPTLAEQLEAAGYHTGAVVGHIFLGEKFGLAQGFQHYDQDLVTETLGQSHQAITSHTITDKAIAFLDQHAAERPRQPWFLWAHYFDPHIQYQHHEGITEIFGDHRRARYNGEIAYADHHIGRLLTYISQSGLGENTVVVFVSDHGEEFLDHDDRLHGKTLFREVIRVPLAIKVPGVEPRRVDQPMSVVDLMPTLLDVLSVSPPTTPMAGRSLRPLFRGVGVKRADVLMESGLSRKKDRVLEGVIRGDWKLIIEKPRPGSEAEASAGESVRLYRWTTDPREKHDVADEHPEVVAALRGRITNGVTKAIERRVHFSLGDTVRHSKEEIEQLRALGYVEGLE